MFSEFMDEKSTASSMRLYCLIALITSVIIAIGGGAIILLYDKYQGVVLVVTLVGIFGGYCFGGKYLQKKVEVNGGGQSDTSQPPA